MPTRRISRRRFAQLFVGGALVAAGCRRTAGSRRPPVAGPPSSGTDADAAAPRRTEAALPAPRPDPRTAAALRSAAADLYGSEDAAARVASAYKEGRGPSGGRGVASEAVEALAREVPADARLDEVLPDAVRAAAKADFESHAVVEVDGWLLAETEVALALAASSLPA